MARSSNIDVRLRMRGARQFNREVQASAAQLEAMGVRGAGAMAAFSAKADALKSFGRKMTTRVTLPIVAMGGLATKAFLDFDGAMNKSTAIMGDLSDSMRSDLSNTARQVGKTTKFSAEEAAESYYFLASAGLDAAQSLKALPTVARFGQAGMFDMATATDLLTDAQSALGMKSKDAAKNLEGMARVSDVLVKANVLANGSVEQFSEALTNKAGGALKVLNKDVEEGVAVLAAFADQGVKGRAAGNALNIVFRDLQSASMKNVDEWKRFGVSVYDASGKMRNIGDIVGNLEGKLDGMSDKQKRATLTQLGFQDRSIAFLQTLLGTSKAIKGYEKELRGAGGTTKEIADKQMEAMVEKLKLAGAQVKDLGISLGARLAPALVWLATAAGKVATALGKMPRWAQTALLVFAGLLAVIGPVAWGLGLLAGGVGHFLVVGAKLAPIIKGLAWVTKVWTLALLANPVVLIVVGVIALIAVLVLAYHKVGWFRAAVDAAFAWIKQAAIDTATWVKNAAQWIGNAFKNVKKWITNAVKNTLSFIKKNWPMIIGIMFGPIGVLTALIITKFGVIRSAAGSVVGAVKDRFNSLVSFVKGLPGKISSAASGMWNGVKTGFAEAINWVIGHWNSLVEGLSGGFLGKVARKVGIDPGAATLGTIPTQAAGGTTTRAGLSVVGEEGPELRYMPRSASVIPLKREVIREAVGDNRPIHTHVYLKGREIALAVSDQVADVRARA